MSDTYDDGGNLPVPSDLPTINNELAALEREMADTNPADKSSYSHNAEKQSRYPKLVEARERLQSGQSGESQSIAVTSQDVPEYVAAVAGLGKAEALIAGGLQKQGAPAVEAMMQNAVELENMLGEEVVSSFYGSHGDLQAVVLGELSGAYVPRLPNVSGDRVEEFKAEDTGQLLADRWGNDMARRLAIAKFRINRMLEPLGERGKELWWDFW